MSETGFKLMSLSDVEESTMPRCDGAKHSWALHTSGVHHCRCGKMKHEFIERDYSDMSDLDEMERIAIRYQAEFDASDN